MGNTSTLVVFMAAFSLFAILFTLSVYSVDPCSSQLLGNYILSQSSIVGSQLSSTTLVCSNGVYTYSNIGFSNNLYEQSNLSRGTTGSGFLGVTNTPSIIFPDWLYTGFSWLFTVGAFVTNMVGAPYVIATSLLPTFMGGFAQAIGAFFSVVFLFVLINWITGRDN